jgi:hypothetical protein
MLLVALAAAPAGAAEPGQTVISSDYGSLTISAILQGGLAVRFDGSEIDRDADAVVDDRDDAYANDHVDFTVDAARLILKGNLLSPNLTYVFQGDAAHPGFLLDARMGFIVPEDEGISTTISGGRFLPSFTLMLPRLSSRLETVRYPLYLFSTYGDSAPSMQPFAFPETIGRQVGLNITQRLTPMFQIDVGVFNGFQRTLEAAGWADENDLKDFFARVQVQPVDDLLLAVDYWLGFPVSLDRAVADDPSTPLDETHAASPFAVSATDPTWQNDTAHFLVVEAALTAVDGLRVFGELAYSHQTLRTQDLSGGNPAETRVDALGGWVHVGWTFEGLFGAGMDLELVGRFDVLDPDIHTPDNQMMRVTFGPQFFLEGLHSQVRLNYLANLSQTPLTPGETFDDVRHELLVQLTVEL